MTNHLMGGHASPTALTLGAHCGQSVEHFVEVAYIEESFHFGKATSHILRLFLVPTQTRCSNKIKSGQIPLRCPSFQPPRKAPPLSYAVE